MSRNLNKFIKKEPKARFVGKFLELRMVELSVQSKPAVLDDGAPSEGSGRQKHEGEPPGARAVLGMGSEVEIKSVTITYKSLQKE